MNDIRRSILWVIFGFSMVMLWDQWQVYNGHKALFFPTPASTQAQASTSASAPAGVPQAAAGADASAVAGGPTGSAPTERFEVRSDVLALSLDSEGGSIVRTEFLKHADVAHPGHNVVLLNDGKDREYMAQTGLIGGAWPTHKTPMTFSGSKELAAGQNEVVARLESQAVGGVKLIKTYTLKRGEYAVHIQHEIKNVGTEAVSPQLYLQLMRHGEKPEGESSFYSTFTGPAFYTSAKKYQKVEFSDIDKDKATFEKQSNDGYVAMVQHYFASAWLLPDNIKRDFYARKLENTKWYTAGMITPLASIAPGASQTVDARFFVGPQEEKKLEALYPGLELVKDYGWLTILAKPLYWLLDQLNGYLHNWGWSIVALVVLLKAAFYWLNAQAYRSMAKMKAINPKIQEMRERLKDNPQQMQAEMMKIYREEKVNPMGGCLPIMIQIPVFIALYWVLLSTVEMRNAPWLGWIHDLAAPDPLFILPILMTGTSLLQTWLNPTPPDPMQAKLMWIMPLAFSVMFFFFPAGLVLYWLTNNILSIAQQWMINKQLGVLNT